MSTNMKTSEYARVATHSRIFAWRIPWTEDPRGLQSRVAKTLRPKRLSMHACTLAAVNWYNHFRKLSGRIYTHILSPRQPTGHYKTLRGRHRKNTVWHKSQQDLFCHTSQSNENKNKNTQWNLIKLRSFCIAKETINKIKRQPSEWKKLFANEATNKGLSSEIQNQLL